MKKEKKHNAGSLTPELRFPGFRDARGWVERKLGDISKITIGEFVIKTKQNPNAPYPVYNGGRSYTGFYNEFNNEGNKIIISARGAYAGFVNFEKQRYWAGNSCYSVDIVEKEICDLTFIFQYIKKNENRFLNNQQAANIPSVSKSDAMEFKVQFPSLPEQQKIADCLSSLDELIQYQTKKLEALQSHKRGLLQNLFPAEGETVPKLRFPEFEGTGDWVERKLGEVCEPKLREIDKPTESYLGLGVRSHGKGTFRKPEQDPKGNSMDVLYQVQENDLIVSITFAWEGAIAIAMKVDNGGLVSHRFPTYIFRPEETFPNFFRHIITKKSFVYKLGLISPGGAGRNRVMNKKDFLELKEFFPSLPEQQKIADCLSSMDEEIKIESMKLDELKSHKKGLLQGLFPVMGE